jgi:excisionase family DNA binding protein
MNEIKNLDIIISVLQPLVNTGIISKTELERIKNTAMPGTPETAELDNMKSIKDTCEILRCDRRTVYTWMTNGDLEFTRLSKRKVLIFESSIIRFIEKRKNTKYTHEMTLK